MKKNLVKISVLIMMFFSQIYTVKADNIIDSSCDEINFTEIVEKTNTYKKYSSQILNIYVNRVSNTDEGMRRTICYVLDPKEKEFRYLTYIGDEFGEIIETIIVEDDNESISALNLSDDIRTSVNYQPRERAYICYKEVCSSYTKKIGVHNDNGCSMFIGQSCNVASLLGHPVAAIICKAGVWFACHTSIDKVCNKYVEYQDVCTL